MKKRNGIETIYSPGEGADSALVAALDAALVNGHATYRERPVRLASDAMGPVIGEAAVMHMPKGVDVLFVRPRRIHSINPRLLMRWLAVCRIEEQTIGTHQFKVSRHYRAAVTDRDHAVLEAAFGRIEGNAPDALARARETAEPVDLGESVFVETQGGSRVLYAAYSGLWHGVYKYDRAPFKRADDVPEAARDPRINYPRLAVV